MSKATFLLKLLIVVLIIAGIGGAAHGIVQVWPLLFFEQGLHSLDGTMHYDSMTEVFPSGAKLVYAFYFKTGCPACEEYAKEMSQLDTIGGRTAAVAVNVGQSYMSVNSYLHKNDIQAWSGYPVLLGGTAQMVMEDYEAAMGEPFEGESLPMPLTIVWTERDGEWIPQAAFFGAKTTDQVRASAYGALAIMGDISAEEIEQAWLANPGTLNVTMQLLADANLGSDYNRLAIRWGWQPSDPEIAVEIIETGQFYLADANDFRLTLMAWGEFHGQQVMLLHLPQAQDELTARELYIFLYDLYKFAMLGPEREGLYIVILYENPAYDYPLMTNMVYSTFSVLQDLPYPPPEAEEEIFVLLDSYWGVMSANEYFQYTWMPPYYYGEESALSFIYLQSALFELPWHSEFSGYMNTQAGWASGQETPPREEK